MYILVISSPIKAVLYKALVSYAYDFVLIDLLGEIKAEVLFNYLN